MRIRIIRLGFQASLVMLACCLSPLLAGESRETPLVRAVKRAQESVVNIHSEKTAFDRDTVYANGPGRKINGMGTGVIVDERGYIVTNQHVIAEVDALSVTLRDGSIYEAQVISYDRKHDLAIIKINPTRPLPVIPLGTSSDLMLGETVIAVGNAFGYKHTVTSGIISALSRDVEVNEKQGYKNLIQTDASINPGNSGGPLLNLDGEVVGINVAIRAGAQRIGFAIPIDDARVLIARLLSTRRLNDTYHGLMTRDVKTPKHMQLLVSGTEADSPAFRAGFKPGDVVIHAANVAVHDQADLERAFLGHTPGEKIEVVVQRDGSDTPLMVELAQNTPSSGAPAQQIVRTTNNAVLDATWTVLGVRLTQATESHVRSLQPRYRGGMQVVEVRPDSPAARHGIRSGDILVGLHVWETITPDNISYVLNHPKLSTFDPLKFYVIRGQEVLYGNLELASRAQ